MWLNDRLKLPMGAPLANPAHADPPTVELVPLLYCRESAAFSGIGVSPS